MGNQPAKGSPSAPRSTLSERDAWDVATAWNKQLRGLARLALDRAAPGDASDFELVRHFEWVDLDLSAVESDEHKKLAKSVKVAHAAVTAWFALSCCPAFSGRENPVFWKRVFSAIQSSGPAISDQVGFFDRPEKPFPRLRVKYKKGQEALVLQQLFKQTPVLDKKLQLILPKLKPFMRDSRWQRDIPIAIQTTRVETLSAALSCMRMTHRETRLKLIGIYIEDADIQLDTSVEDLLENTDIHFFMGTSCHGFNLTLQNRAIHGLLSQQGRSPGRGCRMHIRMLDLNSKNASRGQQVRDFRCCCSALPHFPGVTGVRFASGSTLHLDEINAAWLGYSIFHPDAQANGASFSELTLGLGLISRPALRAMEKMAKGNNLLVAMGEQSQVASYYQQVKLRAGTIVHGTTDGFRRNELYTFKSNAWITSCEVLDNPEASQSWVLVVLPGFGIGFVRSDAVLECRCREPGGSSVRKLRLQLPEDYDGNGELREVSKTLFLDVLSLLGGSLRYLDVLSTYPLSVSLVQNILRRCPQLKSLRIRHDGSCWSDPTAVLDTPELPVLEELEMQIGFVFAPFIAPQLKHLRALRITTPYLERFAVNRKSFLAVLERYPQLEYVNWLGMFVRPDWDIRRPNNSYDDQCQRTRDLLGETVNSIHNVALVPLTPMAKLSFLSVVRHFGTACIPPPPIGTLGQDVVENIFSFSSSTVKRQIHIRNR